MTATVRILHVITDLGLGGAETALARLVEQLQPAGLTNGVLVLGGPDTLVPRLRAAGVEVERLGLDPGRPPTPAQLWRLRRAFRRRRPDVVHGWMYHGNLVASAGRWLSGWRVPVIWGVRASLGAFPDAKPSTQLAITASARLSRSTAAVVYCSRASARQHERIGYERSRTVVIPNGVDAERFRPDPDARARLRAELGTASGMPLVGLVARLHPVKGHADLIAAIGLLRARAVPCHLVLAGTDVGPESQALERAIGEAGLVGQVSLLGERHDVDAPLPGLDVFALPSRDEAFPNALAEAMAAGVPCVATDVGDCAWIAGVAGVVVPPRDPAALAAALERVLALDAVARERLGAAARRRVAGCFALADVARRYRALYSGLFGSGEASSARLPSVEGKV